MNSFYMIHTSNLIWLNALCIACICIHTVSVILDTYRYRNGKLASFVDLAINLFELLALASILYDLARVLYNVQNDMFGGNYDITVKYIAYFALLILSVIKAVFIHRGKQFVDMFFITISLPVFESVFGNYYRLIVILTIVFYFCRAIFVIIRYKKSSNSLISYNSMNEAINAIDSGVMFCEEDGFTLICNRKMLDIMVGLFGKIYRNGIDFYNNIAFGGRAIENNIVEVEDSYVFFLDKRYWSFTKSTVLIDNRTYFQLSAVDVTKFWETTVNLRNKTEELKSRGDELKEAIAYIEQMCIDEEMLRMKSTFHDVLGQRIAVLLRNLRENKEPDEELLNSFADSFYDGIHEVESFPGSIRLQTICNMMRDVGIDVKVRGQLPESKALNTLFVDTIREGVTNAVRHGFADEIKIDLIQDDRFHRLIIENNGIIPTDNVIETGGLKNLREKLQHFDGSFEVITDERYKLIVSIPIG